MTDPKIDEQLTNLTKPTDPLANNHISNDLILSDISISDSANQRSARSDISSGAEFNCELFNQSVNQFGPLPYSPKLIFMASTDSTMNEPKKYEYRYGPAPIGTVFIAAEQTAGTGQDGRWHTGPNDIAMTMVLPDIQDARLRAAFQFSVGIAVIETLKNHSINIPELAVKWPNDVFTKSDWQKLAGILNVSGYEAMKIESLSSKGYTLTRSNMSCGIGINLGTYINHQTGLRGTPTSVEALTGELLSREVVAAELACRIILAHEAITTRSEEACKEISKYLLTRTGGYVEMDLNPNEQTVKGSIEKISWNGIQFRHNNGQLDLLPLDLVKRIYPDSSIRRN